MRPSAFANGNSRVSSTLPTQRQTSMRPSAFANGNGFGFLRVTAENPHFNEAVGFRQRKFAIIWSAANETATSMRPSAFANGNMLRASIPGK